MEDMVPLSGLRGICAMAIFLGHQTDMFLASLWQPQKSIGLEYLQAVSIFFFLSGIPLARLYGLSSMGNKKADLSTREGKLLFWRKRVARLAPMYYLTLCLNLFLVLFITTTIDMKATLASFFGCAFLLQSWFVSLINVGGVLWQIAIFAYGYALFPFVSKWISNWSTSGLNWGILILWLVSAGQWGIVFAHPVETQEWDWWVWHVRMVNRFPHLLVGVLLGEIVQRKRNGSSMSDSSKWAVITDVLSVILLMTAVQSPIVQWYYGVDVRNEVSIGFEAILLPVHILWLAGIILAHRPSSETLAGSDQTCWTCLILSSKPLVALGDISLVLYCLHLVILFSYTALYAYLTTGDWHIVPSVDDYTLRVQVPWWHAPFQWILVIVISYVVARWVESPMRRFLSKHEQKKSCAQRADSFEEQSESLPFVPSRGNPDGQASNGAIVGTV